MGKAVAAKLKYLRMSPRKVGLVAALIRGEKVKKAREILKFTSKRAAGVLLKLLESAVANARNLNLTEDNLRVKDVLVGPGPALKRGRPVSRGRWHPILKRTTHVTVELEEMENQISNIKKKET